MIRTFGKDQRKEKKSLIKNLDTVFAEFIKNRDGYTCQKCLSKSKQMNCAHFYSRSIKALRWEPLNAVCLCAGCHINFAHKEPYEFYEWYKKHIGENSFLILQSKKRNIFKTSIFNLKTLLGTFNA